MNSTQNVNSIFQFATEWHQANKDLQIPEDLWKGMTQDLDEEERWSVEIGKYSLSARGLDFIPILAALIAGKREFSLLNACRHHNIQPYFLNSLMFDEISTGIDNGLSCETEISPWDVYNALVQSISCSHNDAKGFERTLPFGTSRPDLAQACLHSKQSILWPINSLSKVRDNPGEIRNDAYYATDIGAFSNSGVNLESYTDDQVLELIKRSGNLLDGLTPEKGLKSLFFYFLFTRIDSGIQTNLKKVVQSLNSVNDTNEANQIGNIIARQLENHNLPWGYTNGIILYEALHNHLDKEKYKRIFDSTLLRVCSTSIETIIGTIGVSPGSVNEDLHQDVLSNSSKLLKKLVDELSLLCPDEYNSTHFYALDKLISGAYEKPDLDGLDLNSIALKTITALESYLNETHYDGFGEKTTYLQSQASINAQSFISYLSKHMDIEYSRFKDVSAESRIFLASAGFDIKKIPNLTRHERGLILYDQLGL